MSEKFKVDKELNFAGSLILASVLLSKYNVELANISINENGCFVEFSTKQIISSNDLQNIEISCYDLIDLAGRITLGSKDHLNKYEQYFSEHNTQPSNFYNVNGQNVYSFGYELKVPFDIKTIKVFKLLSIGGTKWLNDDHNETLVRINAIAFSIEAEAKAFLEFDKERKERDHRKIGEDLKIFRLDPLAGQGLPLWLPRGFALKDTLSKFINGVEFKYHFTPVSTPILGSVDLYKTSGHYAHYKDNMFPEITLPDGESLVLRPMTCPHHVLVYRSFQPSYKDLPIRLSEDSILHRYEASGGLTGLERVRTMDLADIHIFARPDQIKSEIKRTYEMLKEIHSVLGIEFCSVDLSLHDPNDKAKFYDNPEMWKNAENQLREALKELGVNYKEEVGEAAFYGPKIDFQAKSALGHTVTVSTIQLDFLLPERFKLTYKDKDNTEKRPIMIHVSAIGTYERFVAILLEQSKGKLPLWLAPDQVVIIPIDNQYMDYALDIEKQLREYDIRTTIDSSEERLSKKIRDAQTQKIPYQIVIGKDELKNKTISVRKYGEDLAKEMTLDELITILQDHIKHHVR